MKLSTENLILSPDAAIDLQLHTVLSDGVWTVEELLEHLVAEGFGLAAITDHERPDTVEGLQKLAIEQGIPLLVAAEMTCEWRGQMTDVLCFGFDPENNHLVALAEDIQRRQSENSKTIFDNLKQRGYDFHEADINMILAKHGAQQPKAIIELATNHDKIQDEMLARKLIAEADFAWATNEIARVVDAAHESGAVAILAHPGRTDGFMCYDSDLLDQLRQEAPIDGIEVYYPAHSEEQKAMYIDYANKHDLLVSSGSDSHGSRKLPIKYPARLSTKLLERLGIEIQS